MAQADDVRASIKVCMFDQYGTVVDMQTGLTEAAAPFLAAKGWQGDPNSFVTWWRRTHFENSMIVDLTRSSPGWRANWSAVANLMRISS